MPKHIFLSYPLGVNDPRPPAIPAPVLKPLYTIDKDGASVHILTVANHTGTHVDAPGHVIRGGVPITAYQAAEFIFTKPVVVDVPANDDEIIQPDQLRPFAQKLRRRDIALFRFRAGKLRRKDPERFRLHSPGFGIAAAQWLRQTCPSMRAIGMNVPSLACIAHLGETMPAHNELLGGKGRRFLVIEDMNLEPNLDSLREVRLCPWLVKGMDSSPCAVLGVLR